MVDRKIEFAEFSFHFVSLRQIYAIFCQPPKNIAYIFGKKYTRLNFRDENSIFPKKVINFAAKENNMTLLPDA